jgi:hypothetical protein
MVDKTELDPLVPFTPPAPTVIVYATPEVTPNADSADAPPPEDSPMTDDLNPPPPPPPPKRFEVPFGVAPQPPPPATTRYCIRDGAPTPDLILAAISALLSPTSNVGPVTSIQYDPDPTSM